MNNFLLFGIMALFWF